MIKFLDYLTVPLAVLRKVPTTKRLVLVAILLLVISESFALLVNFVGELLSYLTAIGIFAVYLYCGRKARQNAKATFYFLLPCLLFTVIPFVYNFWSSEDAFSWFTFIWNSLPFAFSFLLPVLLLMWVYHKLPND